MALTTWIRLMAIVADSVNLLIGLIDSIFLLQVMTITAILLLVAVHAFQSEQVDMLLVMQGNDRSGLVGRCPDSHIRGRDHGMRNTDNIGGIDRSPGQDGPLMGQVTHDTLGVVTPFPVTSHALTVVGSFQSRLSETLRFGGTVAVAFPARGKLSRRAVMMAMGATFTHTDHFCMMFVVESDREVKVLQLAEDAYVRALSGAVSLGGSGCRIQTTFQTGFVLCGRITHVAIAAGRLRSVLLGTFRRHRPNRDTQQ